MSPPQDCGGDVFKSLGVLSCFHFLFNYCFEYDAIPIEEYLLPMVRKIRLTMRLFLPIEAFQLLVVRKNSRLHCTYLPMEAFGLRMVRKIRGLYWANLPIVMF